MPQNHSDHARRIAFNGSAGAYVEITVVNACHFVTARQLPSEGTQVNIDVRYRSSTDADSITDQIPAGTEWSKGKDMASARPAGNQFQPGDTIGYFRSAAAGAGTLVVREHTI